jgi:hypothetical protein
METAHTSASENLPGRHRASRRPRRRIPVIGTVIAAVALSASLALSLTGLPGRAASAAHPAGVAVSHVQLTASESASLHKLVSTSGGRQELFTAFADSYGRVGQAGTGPVATPGTTRLDLSWGFSGSGGEHFWIIASYADILGGALARMTPYCVGALTPLIDPAAAVAVCGGVLAAIVKLAHGQRPLSNHGVWAEVHFRPFWTGAYTW